MIEKTLHLMLSEIEGIKLFPMIIPQERELAAVVYRRAKTTGTNTLKGTNPLNDNGLFEIHVRGTDYMTTADLSERIRNRMNVTFGTDSLLMDYFDCEDSEPGNYHRLLIFSLREIRTEGGS